MKIIYKQPEEESCFKKHGIKNCCFKLLSTQTDFKNSTNKKHSHTEFEIHIINSGHQTYDVNGKIYRIESGNMLIIPPKQPHCLCNYGKNTSKCAVTFSLGDDFPVFNKNKCISLQTPALVLNNIQDILAEYKNHLLFSQQILENSIFNIVVQVLRLMKYKEVTVQESTIGEDYRLSIAKQYIKDNIELNLKISDVAAYCYLCTKQLTRLFKNSDNITPVEYIRIQKIKRAEHLINTGLPLADISEKLNFSSQYHFNSFFKKYAGQTPGDYRKMLQQ